VSLHPTWVAEFRRGTLIRIVAAHDLGDLRCKVMKAITKADAAWDYR
jgi:hypothetical protein